MHICWPRLLSNREVSRTLSFWCKFQTDWCKIDARSLSGREVLRALSLKILILIISAVQLRNTNVTIHSKSTENTTAFAIPGNYATPHLAANRRLLRVLKGFTKVRLRGSLALGRPLTLCAKLKEIVRVKKSRSLLLLTGELWSQQAHYLCFACSQRRDCWHQSS